MYITEGYWGNKFPYSGKWRYRQAPGGGELPYMGHIGMCREGYAWFSSSLL